MLKDCDFFQIVVDYLTPSRQKLKSRYKSVISQLKIAFRVLRREMFLKIEKFSGNFETSIVFYDDVIYSPDDHVLLFVHARAQPRASLMPSYDFLNELVRLPISRMRRKLRRHYESKQKSTD